MHNVERLVDSLEPVFDQLTGGPMIEAWEQLQTHKKNLLDAGAKTYGDLWDDPGYRSLLFGLGEQMPMADAGNLVFGKIAKIVPKLASQFTGSTDIKKNVPITRNGRDISEWDGDDWAAFGKEYGASKMGPLTKPVSYRYSDGQPFEIPGGLTGEFTYYDMLQIKNQGIDPSRIPASLHAEIQKKIARSVMPENLSDEQLFNQLTFGLTSPNNPLFPNELAVARVRVRSKSDIDRIAKMIDWEPGAVISKDRRKKANTRIAKFFAIQAAGKGGLGVRGSADYTNIAELAKLFQKNPKWFRKGGAEEWDEYVERLMSQVRGLSAKTASFSGVWQDPVHAAISVVDRHMATIFKDRIFLNDAARMGWETRTVNAWNKKIDKRIDLKEQLDAGKITPEDFADETANLFGPGNVRVDALGSMLKQNAGEGHFVDMLLSEVTKSKTTKVRLARTGGGINPDLPKHLTPEQFISEPEKVQRIGDVYRRALKENAQAAEEQGLGLFASQWMLWDRQRRRLEPHEIMHPGLSAPGIPALSLDQARAAKEAHRQRGYTNYQKDAMQRLKPTRAGTGSPSRLATIGAIPPALIGTSLLMDEDAQ